MEGEREEQGDSTQSGTAPSQADAHTQLCGEETRTRLQEAEEDDLAEACDGEAGEDRRNRGPRESPTAADTQDDRLPLSPLPTDKELTPPSVSSHPSGTPNRPSEPCWYCFRSLDSECRPPTPQQEEAEPSSALPSPGQRVLYQTDPRPHFGIAWSSHSTCRPLWGSEGPCWGQRNQEEPDRTHTCPHCHLGLPADTLRWHEAKCLLFEGLRSPKK